MELDHIFIPDPQVLPDLVGRLWDAGYVPSFVMANETRAGVKKYKVRLPTDGTHKYAAEAHPREHYIDTAVSRPHRGIGVQCPVTRIPDVLLCGIDVDAKAPEYSALIASTICGSTPTRFGGKGCAMFVTMRTDYRREVFEQHGIDGKNIGTPGAQLEFMGLVSMQHLILPPTQYDNQRDRETDELLYYKWIPFPSPNPVKQSILPLWNVPVEDLIQIDVYHVVEMSMHMNKKNSALAKFILGDPWSGPGDGAFRDRVRDAVHLMVGEGFPDDYIELRIEQIARDLLDIQPNAAWGADCTPLMDDVTGMIKGSRRQTMDPKVGKRGGLKIPIDRQMLDWLDTKYAPRDVRAFGGEPHHWEGDKWTTLTPARVQRSLYETWKTATPSQMTSVTKSWMSQDFTPAPEAKKWHVYTLSGVVDVTTMVCRDLEREDWLVHPMQAKFNPNAVCPSWDAHVKRMLLPPPDVRPDDKKLADDEHRRAYFTLNEYLGYCLSRSYAFQKALFIIGAPGCGKGTLWRILKRLFPPNSVSTLSMDDLDSDDVRLAMVGRLVNIGSEVGRKSRDVDRAFNQITAHEEITVWRKHFNKYGARLDTRLIFDGNDMPDTYDTTGAFKRRSIILKCSPLPDTVERQSTDDYDAPLLSELEGILLVLLHSYKRLLERKKFEEPHYVEGQNEQLRLTASPVAVWVQSHVTVDEEHFATNGSLYSHFTEWMADNGFRPMNSVTWGKKMTSLGFQTINKRQGEAMLTGRRIKISEFEGIHPGVKF